MSTGSGKYTVSKTEYILACYNAMCMDKTELYNTYQEGQVQKFWQLQMG